MIRRHGTSSNPLSYLNKETDQMASGQHYPTNPSALVFGALLLAALVFAIVHSQTELSPEDGIPAEPALSFTEAKQDGTPVFRTDEKAGYLLKIKNVGDAPTNSSVTVTFDFPEGVQFGFGEGPGSSWECIPSASVCTTSLIRNAGDEFPALTVFAWLLPGEAPEVVTAKFAAFGGGAKNAVFVQDTFMVLPGKAFGFEGFRAAGCTEPPAASNPGLCFDAFGSIDSTVAGEHPFAAGSNFMFSSRSLAAKILNGGGQPYEGFAPVETPRDVYFELPAGFIGNPEAIPGLCTFQEVKNEVCPASAAIGGLDVETADVDATKFSALFRVVPEDGYLAAFATKPVKESGVAYLFRAKLRSNGDYGATAVSPLPPQNPWLMGVKAAVLCAHGVKATGTKFEGCRQAGEPGANSVPFLNNPTRCAGAAPVTNIHADSFENPGQQDDEGFPVLSDSRWASSSATSPSGTDCVALTEAWVGAQEPSFTFQPDSDRAAASAGYDVNLHIPQDGLVEPTGRATAHLKDTTVTLPEGIALNPSAADGLDTCTLEQAGYLGNEFPAPNRIRFKTTAPGCPGSSKVATVEVTTPVLGNTLPGAMYLAAQDENPFGTKFAVYLVVDDPKTGVKATIPGRVTPDPVSGRITTTFSENPQAPIEDVDIEFFEGARASLANPDVCGHYNVATEMTPWSAADPYAPAPNEIARPGDKVEIKTAASGQSSCPTTKAERPFAPGFEAGSDSVFAGAHTKFSLRITRGEGEQELSGVKVMTPPGFAATLKGVEICSEGAVSAAKAAGRTGKAEMASPSCPAGSQVGTTTVGAGAGPSPFYVKTGKVYLTGPYKGAPLSFTFIVPAVAGPFDLGVQVVRAALNVDPSTAAVTAVSDPLPQILEGVPLQVRDVRVELDRANFALNPTNCEPMAITAELTGGSGAVSKVGNRFQVGGCEGLPFKPKLKLQLHGSPKRAEYQRLVATVTAKPGEANIARAAVTFPHSIFLAQEHIRTVCTRVQFAADACPKGSIYGQAEAESPLLDGKLTGPVYLRSSNNLLPDVVVALRGPDAQPIEVELAGRVDSKNQGIRNSFELVPDAPVSKFTLRMYGGEKSLLVNSRHLCKGSKQRATVRMLGQNNKRRDFRPVVGNDCGKKNGKSKKKKSKQAKQSGFAQAAIVSSWPLDVF